MPNQTIGAISFELRGKFAHFRKFYTNSSSLTYPIPPPTSLMGIVGAAMGIGRDEYIELLDGLRFNVRPLMPWRTIFQTINLLKVTDRYKVTGKGGHTQVPTQFLVPRELDSESGYFIIITHPDEELLCQAEKGLKNPYYPIYMGVAYCPARIAGVKTLHGKFLARHEGEIYGALRVSQIENGPDLSENVRVHWDRYPIRLHPSRKLKESDDLLVEENGRPLNLTAREVFFDGTHYHALI